MMSLDKNAYLLLTLLVVLGTTTILALITPLLTRRDILFGVTVPPGSREQPAFKRITVGYSVLVLLASILAAAILVAGAQAWGISQRVLTIGVFVPVLLLAHALPFLWAYFRTKRLVASMPGLPPHGASSAPAASLAPRRYRDLVPPVWELASLLIIGGTAAWLAWLYPNAPDPFPSHFDANGQVNGHMAKSLGSWFLVTWIQLLLWVLLTAVTWTITLSKAVPTEADARFRRTWARVLFGIKLLSLLEIGGVGAAASLAAVEATPLPSWFLLVSGAFSLAVLLLVLIFSLRTGQGGSRLDASDANATDRTADSNWVLGTIYFNRNDPALFVERRFGIGWTVNLGNPTGVAILLGILIVALGMPLALTLLRVR